MSYTYTDTTGSELGIEPSTRHIKAAFVLSVRGTHVLAADLPEIVAGLYRAAGQEPPILLPRCEPEEDMTRDGKVRAVIRPSGENMTVADALDIASWYATAAEKAAAEALSQPDPAQVEDLAEVIDALADGSTSDVIARAILRAGYARTEDKA